METKNIKSTRERGYSQVKLLADSLQSHQE